RRVRTTTGYDTGVRTAAGRDRRTLSDVSLPGSGTFSLQLWLRDEAGNDSPSSAETVPLRLDGVKPAVAFSTEDSATQVIADVADEHSGPAYGEILYRRVHVAQRT